MSEARPTARVAPRLPLGIAIGSIVIALVSMTLLILLLYEETRGPVEILREFARRVDRADCAGSYDLLDVGVQTFSEDEWCAGVLPATDEGIDADFRFERAVLEGNVYDVEISGVRLISWRLIRHGERSWRVLGPSEGFPAPAEQPAG
jgi:hypothetical protein